MRRLKQSEDAGFFARRAKQTRANDRRQHPHPTLARNKADEGLGFCHPRAWLPREGSRFLALLLALCAGCVNVSMTCQDKVSTVTYKGIALTGTTSVSCAPMLNGGYDIEVGGMNLLALAAAVAPLVAAKQPHAAPSPSPLLQPSGRGADN